MIMINSWCFLSNVCPQCTSNVYNHKMIISKCVVNLKIHLKWFAHDLISSPPATRCHFNSYTKEVTKKKRIMITHRAYIFIWSAISNCCNGVFLICFSVRSTFYWKVWISSPIIHTHIHSFVQSIYMTKKNNHCQSAWHTLLLILFHAYSG